MQVVTVGRLADNTVQIFGDSQVSRHHIQLSNDNGQYYITDLNSLNGTFVNGNRISGIQKLQMRDVVRLGNTTIPWLMYFDANYVAQLRAQRPQQQGAKPQANPVGQPASGNMVVGAVYVDPRGGNNRPESNGMAIAGFVLSFFIPLLGLIFSAIGVSRAKKLPQRTGYGLAVAGLIISILAIVIGVVVAIILANSPTYYYFGY